MAIVPPRSFSSVTAGGFVLLNDLIAIERGLTAHGVDFVGRHPDIKDMAKGWAFRVRLAADGRVASVEIEEEAGRGRVWTLRDGQHNSFPGLKTAGGLLSLNAEASAAHALAWEACKTPAARREEVMRLLNANPIDAARMAVWPNAGHLKRIRERLEALRPLMDDRLTAAVPAAFERFLAALAATPSFLEDLVANLAERVRNRDDKWVDPVRAALVGPIVLAIDVPDTEFPRDAGDARQIGPVSVALSGPSLPPGDETNTWDLCALSGKTAKLHMGNFPQPNLPGLGQTYLFSRNKDIPSLTRYGRGADASFRIDSDLVRRLSGAITELTREDWKGRTWRLIPAEAGDKRDLLVVSMADPGVRLADAVADDDEVRGEAALKELGSRVIDQSKGVYEHDQPEDDVTVLILRTVDPANRKAIYHRKTTSAKVWEAARRWQAATSNTPSWLGFPYPVAGKSEAVMRHPPHVAPLSITALSRTLFANGGRRRVTMTGAPAAAAFGLFLHEGDVKRCGLGLLRLLIRRHGALLSGLAAARAKGIEHLKDFDPKADLRRDALRSITWLGALLYHLGRLKESYMTDAGFRLGQLLAVADAVHVGYCLDVRNGSIPSSLLGNAVLDMAASKPHQALALLLRRWPPYAAWAMNSSRIYAEAAKADKEKASSLKTAIWQARRIKPIAAELADQLRALGSKTEETFKAQLLLGYIAGLPKIVKSEDHAAADNDDSNEKEIA